MRLVVAGLLLLSVGCSTRPFVDFLDFAFPARQPVGPRFYGGVSAPQPTAPGPSFLEETGQPRPPVVSGPTPPLPPPPPE